MKKYIKNSILALSLLFSFTSKVSAMQPVPFQNDAQYNGGICFANSALQCIFQFAEFNKVAKNQQLQLLSDLVNKIETGRQVCAWPLVQSFYNDADPFDFSLNMLMILGLKQGNYNYDSNHGNFYLLKERQYNRNLPISTSRNQFNTNLSIKIVPELDMILVRPETQTQASFSAEDFTRLGYEENDSLKQLWANATDLDLRLLNTYSFELKGVVVMTDPTRFSHAIAYVNHNDQWIKCDDMKINNIGNFEAVKNDIYNEESGLPTILFFERIILLEEEINFQYPQTREVMPEEREADIEYERILKLSVLEQGLRIADTEMNQAIAESLELARENYRGEGSNDDIQLAMALSIDYEKQDVANNIVNTEINTTDDLHKLEVFIENTSKLYYLLETLSTSNGIIIGTSFLNEYGLKLTKEWLAQNINLN